MAPDTDCQVLLPVGLSTADRVDVCCDLFENAWRVGQRPEIVNYLKDCQPHEQSSLFVELMLVEWELRDSAGENPGWGEYFSKYREFTDLIEAVKFKWNSADQITTSAVDEDSLRRIAHFVLLEKIGKGAAGEVWRARDTRLQREVAIKLSHSSALSEEVLSQLLNEAQAAAKLHHPGIVSIFEVGRVDDVAYIISNHIAGMNLEEWLRKSAPSARSAAQICQKIARALQHAHEQKVIHRDLKPANVLIDTHGEPWITDFGLARVASAQSSISVRYELIGTPAYMSPEQARGESGQVDGRSDVYSVGVMLYEMLTGVRPFTGNLEEVVRKTLTQEPVRPRALNRRIPRDLEAICLRAMAKQVDERYRSANELAEDLERFLQGRAIRSRRSITPVVRRVLKSRAAPIVLFAIVTGWGLFGPRTSAVNPQSDLMAPRPTIVDTEPPKAKLTFVPISELDGTPKAELAFDAPQLSPTTVKLRPGDYWVQAVLPDGRFHEVMRHVPKPGEQFPGNQNHLSWTEKPGQAIQLPAIKIIAATALTNDILVNADEVGQDAGNPGDDRLHSVAFVVEKSQVTVADHLAVRPYVPQYLAEAKLDPTDPIPLVYDDAVRDAELLGKRLPTEDEWQAAQTHLPKREHPQLAEWTGTSGFVNPGAKIQIGKGIYGDNRVARGGTLDLVRGELKQLDDSDYDPAGRIDLNRERFHLGVGVRCVRSKTPRFSAAHAQPTP